MKEPTNHELSSFLEIDESLINDVLRYQDNVKSLDEFINEEDKNLTLLDKIDTNNNISIDNILLKEGLKTLNKEELSLIKMRYFQEKTQSEVASLYGTNQVQISRKEQKVLKKLKNNLCQT